MIHPKHYATITRAYWVFTLLLGGVAKDLTKMSVKSYLKFLVAPGGGRLMGTLLSGAKFQAAGLLAPHSCGATSPES